MVTCTAMALGILLPLSSHVFAKDGVLFDVNKTVQFPKRLPHATFILHADFLQNSSRGVIAQKMGGIDAVEFEVFESISHYGPCRLGGVTISPERHTNPITKFCALVVIIGMKADAAAQATVFANPDQQPKFV